MVSPKATYDYGTGYLSLEVESGSAGVPLTGEEFDSIVEQLAEVCTAEALDYNAGYDVGYAAAEAEVADRYHEGYDDGYDDGHSDGYKEAQQEIESIAYVSSEDDEDDE